MRKALLFILAFPFTSHATADCREVNLVTQSGSPFSKLPIYHQERTNICYAYAASQLVDFHRLSDGAPGRAVHPAWLALSYARAKGRKQLDIGHTRAAIEAVKTSGNCEFNEVTAALKTWALEPRTDAGVLADIEREKSADPVSILEKLLSSNCSTERLQRLELPEVRALKFSDLLQGQDFGDVMEKLLNQRPRPISVSYCANVWKESKYSGIVRSSDRKSRLATDCRYHESIVVGKKSVGGLCRALVRNTFGDGWNSTNRSWSCLCRNRINGEFVEECRESTHPGAEFAVEACWLPMELLSRNTGVLTFLE